jgi:hypothetical protein
MYGIDLEVTPLGTIRKMNPDNIVCSTLTNMNELRYVMYDKTMIMFHDYARMNLCTFMFKNKSTRCYMISIRHGLE